MSESTVHVEFGEDATRLLTSIYEQLAIIAERQTEFEQRLRAVERYTPYLIG